MEINSIQSAAGEQASAVQTITGKPYMLRKLQAKDISPMARIIGKIGIDELISCYGDDDFTELLIKMKNRKKAVSGAAEASGQDEGNVIQMEAAKAGAKDKDNSEFIVGAAVAVRIANKILMNLERCEKEVYGLLGSLAGMSAEEIAELDLDIFIQMITDVIRENNVVNFFRAAAKLVK